MPRSPCLVFVPIGLVFALAAVGCAMDGAEPSPPDASRPANAAAFPDGGSEAAPDPFASSGDAGLRDVASPSWVEAGGPDASLEPEASVPPPPPNCDGTSVCSVATDMGSVVGDNSPSSNSVTAQGTTSQWLSVRVNKSDRNPVYSPSMKAKVILVSPPGANYDLYVYYNMQDDLVECSNVSNQSMNPSGQIDSVTPEWGGGWLRGDDSRTLSIEVRYVSGSCSGVGWNLTVSGN